MQNQNASYTSEEWECDHHLNYLEDRASHAHGSQDVKFELPTCRFKTRVNINYTSEI